MRLVFDYTVFNFSDKAIGPADLSGIFGHFPRDSLTATFEPDGYFCTKGYDIVSLEDVQKKLSSLAVQSSVEDHLIFVTRKINNDDSLALFGEPKSTTPPPGKETISAAGENPSPRIASLRPPVTDQQGASEDPVPPPTLPVDHKIAD